MTVCSGKLKWDGHVISDMISLLRIYQRFLVNSRDSELVSSGVNLRRVRTLHRSVSEIARRLQDVLPGHRKYLRLFYDKSVQPWEVDNMFSLKPDDCEMVRVICSFCFMDRLLLIG